MAEEVIKKGFKALLQSAQIYVWAGLLVVSAVTFVYTKGMKAEHKRSSNVAVIDSIASFSTEIRAMRTDVSKVVVDQAEAKAASIEAKNAYNSLRGIVLDLVKKQPGMTFDQFQQYIEGNPELKKNLNLNWTPIVPIEDEPQQYILTSGIQCK